MPRSAALLPYRHLTLVALTLVAVLLGGWADAAFAQGREGNERYRDGAYEEAAAAYRKGLDALEDAAAGVRYGLQNNLGSALYRLGRYEDARQAFDAARAVAQTEPERARAAYNAGNAAFDAQSVEDALAYYRTALLHDPANRDARFNYEIASRRLEQERQQSGQSGQDRQQQPGDTADPRGGEGEQPEQQPGQDEQEGEQDPAPQDQPDDGQQTPEQEGEPGEPGAPPQEPSRLSREDAEQILQALQSDEQRLLREARKLKTYPRVVEKDW